MVMGLIGAGLGVAAPAVANALGIGKNDTRAKTFDESSAYNPNAFYYGGRSNGANNTAARFAGLASQSQNRGAPQAGLVGVNYGRANAWEQNAVQDRNTQGTVAQMMLARAQGQVPSIASQQAALDMQRAAASQASAGASARGAAGLALAGQNAANNTATMQSAISNQAQINAANERLAAEQGAFGAYSGMRAGDAQAQAQAAQQAQYRAQLGAQQNQFNAGLQSQNRAQNDAYSLGLYGQEAGVRQMQLQGGMASQGLLGQSQMNATNQNVAISQNNANREYQYYQQAMGALGGGLSGGAQMMSTPATPAPQPATGVGASPTGVGAGGSTNMVGIPTPSDDRMKSGITPLGLLGVYGGGGMGMNPASGPVGGGAMGAAPSSYEVLSGGGENVAASGDAMSRMATRYATDPTGGMQSGGLLSDDRAKQAAFNLGKSQGRQDLIDDVLSPKIGLDPSWDPSTASLAEKIAYANVTTPYAGLVDYLADKIKGKPSKPTREPTPGPNPADLGERGLATEPLDMGERLGSNQLGGRGRPEPIAPDPVTDQFATGLAPIRFQYKPGMGPAGEQTGVRAQGAASQPVTSSMVTQRPDGLLQIDPAMGLGTALAGVGHLAKKQQDNEAKLNGLLAMAARREGY